MDRYPRPLTDVRVVDLVLDPSTYYDLLIDTLHQGWLDTDAAACLVKILPVAIAQLDAIGDAYGALALSGLYTRLGQLTVAA